MLCPSLKKIPSKKCAYYYLLIRRRVFIQLLRDLDTHAFKLCYDIFISPVVSKDSVSKSLIFILI